jgi:hypothetical protein
VRGGPVRDEDDERVLVDVVVGRAEELSPEERRKRRWRSRANWFGLRFGRPWEVWESDGEAKNGRVSNTDRAKPAPLFMRLRFNTKSNSKAL